MSLEFNQHLTKMCGGKSYFELGKMPLHDQGNNCTKPQGVYSRY